MTALVMPWREPRMLCNASAHMPLNEDMVVVCFSVVCVSSRFLAGQVQKHITQRDGLPFYMCPLYELDYISWPREGCRKSSIAVQCTYKCWQETILLIYIWTVSWMPFSLFQVWTSGRHWQPVTALYDIHGEKTVQRYQEKLVQMKSNNA